jgi:CheY-like chemotaxis protein
VSLAGTLRLKVDPLRLEQILVNLLINAAKYTEAGGHIGLSGRREAADVVIKVRDTGVGISPEFLPRIFDLVIQGDRTMARSDGGLGIGLTLVKSLVEMLGGSVKARSEGTGKGSEFEVRLPALEDDAVQTAHDGPTAITLARTFKPQVVLLDIGLPGMDGYEVVKHLRAATSCAGATIVAVSGYGRQEDRRRSRESGFDRHLVKPVDFDALLSIFG